MSDLRDRYGNWFEACTIHSAKRDGSYGSLACSDCLRRTVRNAAERITTFEAWVAHRPDCEYRPDECKCSEPEYCHLQGRVCTCGLHQLLEATDEHREA